MLYRLAGKDGRRDASKHEFESHCNSNYSGVVAEVARQAHNLKVAGSIPASATKIKS